MTVYLKDRVKQVTSTTGTGTITFSSTPSGYQSFSTAYNDGDEVYYVIENRSDYEIGIGTYIANTLSRDTVLKSTNGGAKLSLTGRSTVFVSVPAEKTVYIDGTGQASINLDKLSDVVITTPASGQGVVYNGTNWVNGNISGYTDEQAQDAVAGMLIGSTGINVSYNDVANTLTIASTGLLRSSLNLSDLSSVSTARANLELGTAALSNSGDFYLSTNPSGYISASSVAAGYQPLDGDLTSLAAATGTNTIYYRSATNTWSPVVIGTGISFSGGTLSNTLDLSSYATSSGVAASYVPYTGATGAVDLGSQSLTAGAIVGVSTIGDSTNIAGMNGFDFSTTAGTVLIRQGGTRWIGFKSIGTVFSNAGGIGFAANGSSTSFTTSLYEDSAGILTLRNSTNAQTFNIANTWASTTNFEYGRLQWSGNLFQIGTAVGSAGGTQRSTAIGTWNSAGSFQSYLSIDSTGAMVHGGATFFGPPSGWTIAADNASGDATLTLRAGRAGNGSGTQTINLVINSTGVLSANIFGTSINGFLSNGLALQTSSITRATFSGAQGNLTLTPSAATSGSQTGFTFTAPAPTGQTASTEASMVNWNLASTVTFAAGALTTQRAFRIQAPTYAFASASTITTASTLSISGAPIAGTNATITNPWALNVESGASSFGGQLVVSQGTLTSSAPLTLTQTWNNAAVSFVGMSIDITKTAAALYSPIFRARQGGTSLFEMRADDGTFTCGAVTVTDQGYSRYSFSTNGTNAFRADAVGVGITSNFGGISVASHRALMWSSTTNWFDTVDLALQRDAAGTLSQRSGTTAQTFNIANTWTSATSFEYGRFQWNTNEFRIGTAVGSAGGTQRSLVLGTWNSAGTWTPTITMASTGVITVNTVGSGNATLILDNSGANSNARMYIGAGGVHGHNVVIDPRGTSNWATITQSGASGLRLVSAGNFSFSGAVGTSFAPAAQASGTVVDFTVTAAAHTGQTASTESSSVFFDFSATKTFAAGALTTQRAFRIQAPTYAFASASTITTASTLAISGAPAAGTNATITSAYALNVEGGASYFGGNINQQYSFLQSKQFAGSLGNGVGLGAVFITLAVGTNGIALANTLGWASSVQGTITTDVNLERDAAATLALRNSTNAQTFRVYNTYTSATSGEWLQQSWSSNEARIGTAVGSAGGTQRTLIFGGWNTAGTWIPKLTIVPTVTGGIAIGSATTDRYCQISYSAGNFSASGDAQAAKFVLRIKTTDATATTMMLDGSTTRLTIPSGKMMFADIWISGIKSDGSASATYRRKAAIKNVGGTTSLIGSVETIGTDYEDNVLTDVVITADDTNDALQINVTGIAAETWRWVAVVEGLEIAYGT